MADKDETAGLAVPKFSSFKTKELVIGKDRVSGEKDGEGKKRSHRESDRHRDSKRRRHESDGRRSDDRRQRSRSPAERPSKREKVMSAAKPVQSDAFTFDVKGDPLIRRYGGVERSRIPSYRRYGAGRVLGTAGRLILHREGPRDQFSLRFPGEGSAFFNDRDGLRSRTSRAKRNPILLRPKKQQDAEGDSDGFLALSSSKRSRVEVHAESSDDEALPNYRSIDLKAQTQYTESEEESDLEDKATAVDQDNPLKWRSIQLNRHLKAQPDDINAWIELVDHQDVLMRAGQSIDQEALVSEAHSFSEIKVSMLEKALENTKTPADRERILTYLMAEGVKVWNSKTAAKKWSEVIKDEETSFMLWKTHLDFAMSDIATFQFDNIKEMMIQRLSRVLSRDDDPRQPDQYGEAIYVFLRLTRFLHDAGFKETAVAAWQALLELTFFRPTESSQSQAALALFEEFWESEVARVGESGAQGWKHYAETQSAEDPPSFDGGEGTKPGSSRDAYRTWGIMEKLESLKARLPVRTMDDGTGEDPYRVVMYSDIKPLLFYIPDTSLPEASNQLVNAFLIFCGLPPFSVGKWTTMAWEDQYLSNNGVFIDERTAANYSSTTTEDMARKPPFLDRASFNIAGGCETLLLNNKWFAQEFSGLLGHSIDPEWAQNLLKQLAQNSGLEELAVYLVSLLALESPASVKKTAKALLKQYPANPRLYNAYALAEYAQDHRDVAEKVLMSATLLFASSSASPDCLWLSWAWLELLEGNKELAIKRLCTARIESLRGVADEGFKPASTSVLKAGQDLRSCRDYSLMAANLKSANIQAQCLALLAYLTVDGCTEPMSARQGNISAAMASVDETSKHLRARGLDHNPIHEELLQFAAQLLYFNATKGPYRRSYIRGCLVKYLELFPRNTMFQSLLEWADSGLRVVDETRSFLCDRVLISPYDCVSSRMFAIEHELVRGNLNSTKAAFDYAVASDACKGSIPLWISYIRFCHNHKELRSKAKDAFYTALRHCPWSKDIMMEAFGTLVRDMESSELRSVYETMVSKGLRVHVDLEGYLEARRAQKDFAKISTA